MLGPSGIGSPGRETRNSPWNEMIDTCVLRVMKKLHLCSLSLCLPGFLLQKSGMEARERNMILAATGNRYQLDLVEQAMKIQFLHDEKRDHDDRTGKYHNHILGGDVNEDDDHLTKNGEEQENSEEDLDELATAQEEEADALASLATANRTLQDAREKHHQVRVSRGQCPQKQGQRDSPKKDAGTKMRHLQRSHWASQCPEKQGKPRENKGEATAHTACSEFAMVVHTETSTFARKALVQPESVGSWRPRLVGTHN